MVSAEYMSQLGAHVLNSHLINFCPKWSKPYLN